jgi:agmatine deiminase
VEPIFAAIVAAISRFERVLLVVPATYDVTRHLQQAGAELSNVTLVEFPTNDTWSRDFGPISVYDRERPALLDFGFNGWGLKFAANQDNLVTAHLHEEGYFGKLPRHIPGLILEGGSIESDGQGTILTTAPCLEEPNRNPHLSRQEIEEALSQWLGGERILWLEHGYLAGDDTDSHVDTLARLAPDGTILYVRCDDPEDEHFGELSAMEEELRALCQADGSPYRLLALPWPTPCYDQDGERLPATYANFLIINGAVLVPTHDDPRDGEALATIGAAFPGREIIGIDCRALLLQHGSLHCVTMQLPQGALFKP